MCTLTWWRENDRYGVLFNRDESVKRGYAIPPEISHDGSYRFIRPIDPDGGGTWIWVNETGMIACVLNNYTGAGRMPSSPVSRGKLCALLTSTPSSAALAEHMQNHDCSRYRGFFLFGYDGSSNALISWDGQHMSVRTDDDLPCPITTSGFQPDRVVAHRRDMYRVQVEKQPGSRSRNLETYHTTHNPDLPAHSVLMARKDARTVSHSRITVEPDQVRFCYAGVTMKQRLEPAVTTTLGCER